MANLRSARSHLDEENTTRVDVAAWTQQAIQAMNGLSLHKDPTVPVAAVQGTSVTVQIPLDGEPGLPNDGEGITAGQAVREGYVLRRKSSQRDSMRRRDALLKGKEGSRQRRRWENDRLVGNPYAEPPLPSDWEVRPTHPVHAAVPYYLAPLWDARYAKESAAREAKARAKLQEKRNASEGVGHVPKDLKEKLKRAKGAKSLLQDLESEIRSFVASWETGEHDEKAKESANDSEDEEIVFVGRQGQMHDRPTSSRSSDEFLEPEKLIFDALEGDQSASFVRWLVHSIGQYYDLDTWSITVGNPARREAYVGIKQVKLKTGKKISATSLPRPLWAMV